MLTPSSTPESSTSMSSSSVLHVAASAVTDMGIMAEGIITMITATESKMDAAQKIAPVLFT